MLTLYYRPSCPYCQAVLGEIEALSIKVTLKDISADPALIDELVKLGGKKQVPYLVDTERGEKMYESQDIIAYLNEHCNIPQVSNSFGGLRIHQSPEVCDTCQ